MHGMNRYGVLRTSCIMYVCLSGPSVPPHQLTSRGPVLMSCLTAIRYGFCHLSDSESIINPIAHVTRLSTYQGRRLS